MENKTSVLYDEISYRISTSTGYIENKYPLLESCNTLISYSYKSPKHFENYLANKIYNRINRENKKDWVDIYNEELTLLKENCTKYRNMIQQCLKWDGKLTLLLIFSLCMVVVSAFLIVWMKYPLGIFLFLLGSTIMVISISPHYYAKRLTHRKTVVEEFLEQIPVENNSIDSICSLLKDLYTKKIIFFNDLILNRIDDMQYISGNDLGLKQKDLTILLAYLERKDTFTPKNKITQKYIANYIASNYKINKKKINENSFYKAYNDAKSTPLLELEASLNEELRKWINELLESD